MRDARLTLSLQEDRMSTLEEVEEECGICGAPVDSTCEVALCVKCSVNFKPYDDDDEW